ncbi:pyridoxamine 5'-phosphate oxidase family protein [Pelagibius marinus]|uniref:pyridoxamine 5'-phosphate oxidase family protein n=1 Tax=Pelagibius marinus TaxID=2762760 RepID=UPI001872DB9C|nr:pyridoxamine 5'-phosphate oxidase family protein [Pelagibius marinus]
MTTPGLDFPPTDHSRIKRAQERARYDRETVHAILDAGLLCHVGYVIDGQPYVTPTAYWRKDDRVYWHGSSASKMLRHLKTRPRVCFTVALMDGLVLARSGFHTSVNYRSVMAFGPAELVEDPREKLAALEDMMERIVPGRWPELKPPTAQELKATTVVSLKLEEVAAKLRDGGANDAPEDLGLDVWAGVVPTATVIGAPLDNPDLKAGIAQPENLGLIRIG